MLNPRLSNLTCGAHFFLLFFFKSNIHENHTFKARLCHHFTLFDVLSSETGEPYYISVTPNGFLGHSHLNPRGSPSAGEKRGDTKGETIFDIPGMALRP